MKTYQPKQKEVTRNWHLIDANGEILGRIATKIAILLMGKHKATYSAHMDSGDNVVVINASKVEVTGRKADQKVYRSHSGYPGGLKEITYKKMHDLHPERIIEHAVRGMLPDNRLQGKRMKRLTIVADATNPYADKFKSEKETKGDSK